VSATGGNIGSLNLQFSFVTNLWYPAAKNGSDPQKFHYKIVNFILRTCTPFASSLGEGAMKGELESRSWADRRGALGRILLLMHTREYPTIFLCLNDLFPVNFSGRTAERHFDRTMDLGRSLNFKF
jgi:hypothetical protein